MNLVPQSICGYNTLMELWWFKDTLEVYLLKSERNNRWWMRDRGEWHPLLPVSSLPALALSQPMDTKFYNNVHPNDYPSLCGGIYLAINNQIRSYSQERHMSKFVRGNFFMPISYDCYIIKGNFIILYCMLYLHRVLSNVHLLTMRQDKKPLIPLFAFH